MEFPDNAIVIDQTEGRSNGRDLEECYFIWFQDSQTYSFFDMFGNVKGSGLTVDSVFIFRLDYISNRTWALTIGSGSDSVFVTGKWTDADTEPEGSYQATAGGGAKKKENAASATV